MNMATDDDSKLLVIKGSARNFVQLVANASFVTSKTITSQIWGIISSKAKGSIYLRKPIVLGRSSVAYSDVLDSLPRGFYPYTHRAQPASSEKWGENFLMGVFTEIFDSLRCNIQSSFPLLIKPDATRCLDFSWKCIKMLLAAEFRPNTLEGSQRSPEPLAGFNGSYF